MLDHMFGFTITVLMAGFSPFQLYLIGSGGQAAELNAMLPLQAMPKWNRSLFTTQLL